MQHKIAHLGAYVVPDEADGCVWAANPTSLPPIRAQTRRWLAPLALDEDTGYDVVLAVNEAASNVIDHAYLDTRSHRPGGGETLDRTRPSVRRSG